jgi:hypothetical protein
MSAARTKSQIDLEWEKRTLCIDGNCIGVIGPNGHCKACDKRHPTFKALGDADDDQTHDTSTIDESEAKDAESVEGPGDGNGAPSHSADPEPDIPETDDIDWENRQLCVDGNCIGIIGSDGRCKECGKPAK